ncbi:MAG: thioesterase family protein [Anaerolineae bacterium]
MSVLRPFELHIPIQVMTYDIDFAQIVSNIVYIRWLEDMRVALLNKHMPIKALVAEGTGPALIATHIEYKRPIHFFDEVVGKVWVADIGNTRWSIGSEFLVNGDITTTALQHGVLVNFTTMRPLPVPDEFRAQFVTQQAAWMASQAAIPQAASDQP